MTDAGYNEPERLPRRVGGYTSSARLAIDGTATEVDEAVGDRYSREAHEQEREARQRAEVILAGTLKEIQADLDAAFTFINENHITDRQRYRHLDRCRLSLKRARAGLAQPVTHPR